MRLFLYEFITGGGLLGAPVSPSPSLLSEGTAMIESLAADFAALSGVHVTVLRDGRLERPRLRGCNVQSVASATEERVAFGHFAAEADWTVVIAPEFDGLLLERARRVIEMRGRLLGPPPGVIELASNKQRTAEHLRAANVPVPNGRVLLPGESLPRNFTYPAVVKPIDGAGSQGVRWLADAASPLEPSAAPRRLEAYCPGTPASVALLCGPSGHVSLVPCRQHLSEDGAFAYQGGSLPLPAPLARRAQRLGEQAIAALEKPLGYLGVDLVLGSAADGSEDFVIEVNPRLTTSYVGLRAAARTNLAAAMLAIAQGTPTDIEWRSEPVAFTAAGEVTIDP